MKKDDIYIRRAPRNAQHPYMQLYRKVAQDTTLKLEERGFLIYILSLPLTWLGNLIEMGKKNGMGRDKTRAVVESLRKHGYCQLHHRKNKKGQFCGSIYFFSEDKTFDSQLIENELSNPQPENPSLAHNECEPRPENPAPAFQFLDNRTSPLETETDHSLYIDTTSSKSKDIPPIPPKGEAASAASESGISQEIKDETDKFISVIREFKSDYIAPKQKKSLYQSMKKLREVRSLERILQVLKWAVHDTEIRDKWNGWSSKIVGSKNPVEYLYSKLNNLEIQCDTKPTRKFSPSSDDAKALATLRKSKEKWNG